MKTILQAIHLTIFLFILGSQSLAADNPQASSTPSAKDSEYTISIIPFYGPEKIWALYTPLIDFLVQSTGKPWSLKLYSTHKELTDELCRGQVSMALLGPAPLAKVMAQCNAEPILVALGNDGTPFYHSVIVSADPATTSLDELRGKRIGFFKGSTAAHILPRKILRQAGLNRKDFIPVFLEGQDHIVNALLTRQIIAAGLKEALVAKFKDSGLLTLAISEDVPNFAFAASPVTNAVTKKLFSDALLHLAPASNDSDRQRMATWDDEIKHGFTLPTTTYRAAVSDLLTITNEIMNEDR